MAPTTPGADSDPTPSDVGALALNPRAVALQLLATKAMADATAARMATLRKAAPTFFEGGDRLAVNSPLTEARLGTVTATDPKPEARIVDRDAFNDSMRTLWPEACQTVTVLSDAVDEIAEVLRVHAPHLVTDELQPAEWAVAAVLKLSATAGQPVGPNGEFDPAPKGVEVRIADSVIQIRLDKNTNVVDEVRKLWQASKVNPVGELPAAS